MLHLLLLAPFALSATWSALTPAAAVIAAWILALGADAGMRPRLRPRAALVGGVAAWATLHQLRADAPWWVGAVLLLAAALSHAWWRRGRPARRAAWIAAALTLPAAAGFLIALDQKQPPEALVWADAWAWAAAPEEAARAVRVEDARLREAWVQHVPAAPVPRPLEEGSGQRARALLLVGWALGFGAAAGLARGRRAWRWSLLALPAAAAAPLLAAPRTLEVHVERPAGWILMRVHAEGGVETEVRDDAPATGEPVAWLERRPLAAPASGGDSTALAVLRRWAAVDADGGARRWEATRDGVLVRRLLP